MSRRVSPGAAMGLYAVLALLGILFALPFLWMTLTAFKAPDEVFTRLWPSHLRLANFVEALTQPTLPFGRFFLNTLYITATCTVAGLFSSAMVAYAFVRIPFAGRGILFVVVLSTMMVPAIVTAIPTFYIFHRLGWLDTFLPFIVPALCGNAFQIFFFRQFYKTLPEDLFAAAVVDGCSHWGMFTRIALPLSKPTIATLAILSCLGYWNDFMGPVVYLQSVEKRTLALGLYSFSSMYATEWHLMMAASLVAILPVLAVFFSLQRFFEQGIVMSGFKG